MKIAILGGSFDPIHKGHLEIAKYVLSNHIAHEVWFMPAQKTPLKDRSLTSSYHRKKMIDLAIKPYRRMKLCTLEIDRGEISYSIDTIKQLNHLYPNHQFVWLIGADQANQLEKWKDIEELIKRIQFYVFPRNQIQIKENVHLIKLHMKEFNISSSEIRCGRLQDTMPNVRNYIGKNYLYLNTLVESQMHEKRFLHSLSVANLCVELALVHRIDANKAYVAGLLHDVCKEWQLTRSECYMNLWEPSLLDTPKAIWHAYIAKHYVKQFYKIEDKEILDAINHHVIGSKKFILSMILFVADKLDPKRGYDSSKEIALCKDNIQNGYDVVLNQQQAYLKSK